MGLFGELIRGLHAPALGHLGLLTSSAARAALDLTGEKPPKPNTRRP